MEHANMSERLVLESALGISCLGKGRRINVACRGSTAVVLR